MHHGISVVCGVYNEERRIERFIRSFYEYDEIIIVDKSSTDKTADLAMKMGVKVISIPYTDNEAKVFHAFQDEVSYDWIFYATASDVVHPKFTAELYKRINSKKFNEEYNNINYPCVNYVLGLSGPNITFDWPYRNTIGKKESLYVQDRVHDEIHFRNSKTYTFKYDRSAAVHHLAHESLDILYERWLRYSKKELDKNLSYKDLLKSILLELYLGFQHKCWKLGWKGLGSVLLFVGYRILIYTRYLERDMGDISKKYDAFAQELIEGTERKYRNKKYALLEGELCGE